MRPLRILAVGCFVAAVPIALLSFTHCETSSLLRLIVAMAVVGIGLWALSRSDRTPS